MPNYNPSTIGRIGDIKNGIFVETAEKVWTLWGMHGSAAAQDEHFTVYNRIILHALYAEVIDTLTGSGALMHFNWTSSVPVITIQPLNIVCSDIDGFIRGRRISWVGGAVGSATAVTASAGISYMDSVAVPFILGVAPNAGVSSVSTIGSLVTTVALSAGSAKFCCLYTPIDPGAYIEAA